MRMVFSEKPIYYKRPPRQFSSVITFDRSPSLAEVEPKILTKVLDIPRVSYGMLRNLDGARSCCSGAK